MFETFNLLLKISIFSPLLFICICLITLAATINLCAKKRDSGKLASNKSINVQSIKAVSSKKSVSPCS
uniref:ATP synthase F0 subunit 8 n=1 Tax=Panagrolaimus sp. PS1159 TaxID=55785 RepID=A0AC35EV02_9BILA